MFHTSDVVAAEQHLDACVQALRADGIEAHFLMEYGDPAAAIAKVAAKQGAELVVLAPEHRAKLETLWHPRVTQGLLRRITSPLLILPAVDADCSMSDLLVQPAARVIVALDGSKNAEAALPLATLLAQTYLRPLLLVRVVAPTFLPGVGVEALETPRVAKFAEEAETRHYLIEARTRIAAEGQLSVEIAQVNGSVAEQLVYVAAALPGSVLVMGTHGRGGLARAVFGSVAADVLRASTTPVLIVPSHPAAEITGR
jgi:nucleotide-binding universal stress UspA family protein